MRTKEVPTAASADEVILKIFRVQMSTPDTSLVDEEAGQICLQAGNINRRQQLQGSEDSLGHQQGAEDAEWPSLARVDGTRQPWLATSLGEGKLRTETRSRQGPSPDLPEGRKTQRKAGFKGLP